MAGTNGRHTPTAVVTGASAGVGRAIAVAFAEAGFDVAIIARGVERVESARRECEGKGVRAMAICADVADADAIMKAADRIAEEWGAIDIWVNSAMATIIASVVRVSPEEFKRVTDVTYLGQVHGTLAALKHMRARGSGRIVQVGSALAYRSIPLQSAYCAAKAAVRGFTDSLRCELLHERSDIRLTMVQLPAVNTPQFDWARNRMSRKVEPVPPIYQPEAVANAIVRASYGASREYWLGWPAIRAILANFVAPGLLDRAAAQAWSSQLGAEASDPDRADNLMQPPPGDPGAHGRFDARASDELHFVSSETARLAVLGLALGVLAASTLGAAALVRQRELRRLRSFD